MRTDEEFRVLLDKMHHHKETPWATCPFITDLIWSYPADPMHLMDLGVMKRKLELVLAANFIDLVVAEKLIKDTKQYMPDDFTRKIRTLDDQKHYKATEYRFLALYFGPVLFLKSCKNKDVTNHFLTFFVSYRLLMGRDNIVTNEEKELANILLQSFVEDFSRIYGRERVSSNIHSLLHLTDMVDRHGPLDQFSCYKYENYYQQLRQWIRKPDHYFTQVLRRWVQTKGKTTTKVKGQRPFDSNLLQANKKDSCVLLRDNSVFAIDKIKKTLTGISYIGHRFLTLCNLFEQPILSGDLHVYIASEKGAEETILHKNIAQKMIRFPWEEDKWVVMPIIHSKFE